MTGGQHPPHGRARPRSGGAARRARRARPDDDVRAAARAAARRALRHPVRARRAARPGSTPSTCEPTCRRELELLVARCRPRERARRRAFRGAGAGRRRRARAALRAERHRQDARRAAPWRASSAPTSTASTSRRVVDKYIGETEKNLARVFDRAEQADVVAAARRGRRAAHAAHRGARRAPTATRTSRRTTCSQRLESFRGVLLVTTNAADRIDGAFRRRMDVVVDFAAPAAPSACAIWRAHLPAGHAVDARGARAGRGRAARCTAGQIRTAARARAAARARGRRRRCGDARARRAVRREYRKAGEVCPLRRGGGMSAAPLR